MELKAHFSNIHKVIINHLEQAQTEIVAAIAWFTDRDIFEVLCKKARSGIKVSVALIGDEINQGPGGLNFQRLSNFGGQVIFVPPGSRDAPTMHHKFCVIDSATVITGSYNWSQKARSNDENITIVTDSKDFAGSYWQIAWGSMALMLECVSVDDGHATGLSCGSYYISPIIWQPSLSILDSSKSRSVQFRRYSIISLRTRLPVSARQTHLERERAISQDRVHATNRGHHAQRLTDCGNFDPPHTPNLHTGVQGPIGGGVPTTWGIDCCIGRYRVTPALIERVRSGNWDPDGQDKDARDAMAAKGYFEAHTEVTAFIERELKSSSPTYAVRDALSNWHRALFSPSVQAGLLKPSDLAGWRNDQVYIRGAMHVPLSKEAVRDCMPVLFELIAAELHPGVRAVLGHFFFVYIHPYMDGNGRLGRFLMNAMLVTGGYVWTVVPVERRKPYMEALEQASTGQDIAGFSAFIGKLIREQTGAPLKRPT